jgi:hypothetical protein
VLSRSVKNINEGNGGMNAPKVEEDLDELPF